MEHTIPFRFRHTALSGAVASLLASGAMAAEFTWIGPASGGAWSDGANWASGAAPGDADTAVFTGAAAVAPPASFAGVIRVSGSGCLTADVASAAEFTLALGGRDFSDTGASFRKTGMGTLTLHANGGVNPGSVTIAEGAVVFAGNGTKAAGAFDRVVLESGVSASVAQSPLASRHGYAYRLGRASGADTTQIKADTVAAVVANYEGWACVPSSNTRHEGIQVVSDDAAAFDAGATPASVYSGYCSPDGSGAGSFMVYYRGLFLSENPRTATWQITQTAGNGACARIGINSSAVYGEWKKPSDGTRNFASAAIPRGWAAFSYQSVNDLRWTSAGYYGFNLRHPASYDGDSGVLVGSKLWNGVCFTALEVKSGATLTLADGQAMAVANARAFKVDGSFASASADTWLLLGSDWTESEGDEPLSAAALRSFTGTVELGPTSRLGGDDSSTPVAYTIIGSGELTVTAANRNALAGFDGPLAVAAGVSCELSLETDWTALSDKASILPVSSSTWQLTENTAWADGGASIKVLDPNASSLRAAVIAKTPVPLYCPFEFSCDIYHGDNLSSKEVAVGLFVQTKGLVLDYSAAAWSSRAWYMLPYSGWVFGTMGHFGSSPYVGWITNAMSKVSWVPNNYTAQYLCAAEQFSSWNFVAGKPMRWRLRYDGLGTFTAKVWKNADSDASAVETSFTSPVLAESKLSYAEWWPSILAYANNTSHSALTVSNLSLKVLSGPAAVSRRIALEEGATLTVRGCQLDEGGKAAWMFPNLAMAGGATLAVEPLFPGLATGVSTEGMTATGAATIAPAAGESVSTVVADFTSRTGGGLAVSGDVSVLEPLTVDVSRSELLAVGGAVTLLDASRATAVPAFSQTPSVRDIDGSSKPITVSYAGGRLRANAVLGTVFYVR